jgi:hypothetical protein
MDIDKFHFSKCFYFDFGNKIEGVGNTFNNLFLFLLLLLLLLFDYQLQG